MLGGFDSRGSLLRFQVPICLRPYAGKIWHLQYFITTSSYYKSHFGKDFKERHEYDRNKHGNGAVVVHGAVVLQELGDVSSK